MWRAVDVDERDVSEAGVEEVVTRCGAEGATLGRDESKRTGTMAFPLRAQDKDEDPLGA